MKENKFLNWVKNSEVIKKEKQTIMSVRAKTLYGLAFVWTFCVFYMITTLTEFIKKADYNTIVAIMTIISDKLLAIFYVVSFLFLLMVLVYVLKKSNFHFEAWGIKFDLSENESTKLEAKKDIQQP